MLKKYAQEKCDEYTPFLPQNRLFGLFKSIYGLFVSVKKIMREYRLKLNNNERN